MILRHYRNMCLVKMATRFIGVTVEESVNRRIEAMIKQGVALSKSEFLRRACVNELSRLEANP